MQPKIISRKDWKALLVLILGILITIGITINTHRFVSKQENEEFKLVCRDIKSKIDTRLFSHALVLRSGSAFFSSTDTVRRSQWKNYIEHSNFEKNLPGIQGVGFTMIIPKNELEQHTNRIKKEGFPNYFIYPAGDREVYTSIIYLEPFSGRNLRAFGYDMFTEPNRRKAMELSRDYNIAALSGKVELVQETQEDLQFGTLMYVPVYSQGLPINSVQQRRDAIKGWVYSPHRMNDLMLGILGQWDTNLQNRIHLQLYDDSLSASTLIYDSQSNTLQNESRLPKHTLTFPIEFNGKNWILHFSQSNKLGSYLHGYVLIVLISGTIISLLLFLLTLLFIKIANRSTQLRYQNNELKELNVEKDKFLTIIAHDLRNPLISIVGLCDVLAEQVKGEDYQRVNKSTEMILQSSHRAIDLLMNLMEWALSQTGRVKFNPENFDMVNLISEVELLFTDAFKQKGINIIKSLPLSIPVYADYAMISTILRNLISNAIKFSNSGGTITISAQMSSDKLTISISDTGIGIPKDSIGKLFRIGENFSTYGTLHESGTGIGLILCKDFVEKHGGNIWVESQVESQQIDKSNNDFQQTAGSIFYFTIPNRDKTS
jgi:signal transduction histidine kinase